MPTFTPELFASVIRQAGVLSPAQLEQLTALQKKCPDARSLASEAVRGGLLTPFQANTLNQGQSIVVGSYVLLEKIGEGGMGAVYKARQKKLNRLVAIKLIRKERLKNDQAVKRFQREIQAACKLNHNNVVRAYDAVESDGVHLFVMEYVEGVDLAKLIKDKGPLPIGLACNYIAQAAQGLQHACELGLVHRDIKSHNLLLSRDGVIKILDMGLARHVDESEQSTLTQEGSVLGTPDFLAPEQALKAHTVDIRADIYSLGVTFYFLLAGRVPFPGGSLAEKILKHQIEEPIPVEKIRRDCPREVAQIVRKMMAKKPADRFQKPAEVVAALAQRSREYAFTASSPIVIDDTVRATAGSGSMTSLLSWFSRDGRLGRSPRLWIMAGAGAFLALLLLTVSLVWWLRSGTAAADTGKGAVAKDGKGGPPINIADLPKSLTNPIGIKMVLIPPGKFTMGSPKNEAGRWPNEIQHQVEITKPFYMGVHEVTREQFQTFVRDANYQTDGERDGKGGSGYDPKARAISENVRRFTWRDPGFEQTDAHPVVNVSWNDAMAFCSWLNKKEKEGKQYRLPTEAEWEYACRAGTKTRFHGGDADESIRTVGNVAERSLRQRLDFANLIDQEIKKYYLQWFNIASWDDRFPFTAPVGQFKSNTFGLYDMHGNVVEWCKDAFDPDYYSYSPAQDPPGPEGPQGRVMRGGSCLFGSDLARSAFRGAELPAIRHCNVGFRVVLVP